MRLLLKPHQFSRTMQAVTATGRQWLDLFENPPVIPDKTRAPLAIFGTMVADPELDPDTGLPRCTASNVDSIYALQLDYDSGKSIEGFSREYAAYRWSLYTSHSHGYKGESDRFRVVMPLETPMPMRILRSAKVRRHLMSFHFPGVDKSCFDRGHWQILPCIREPGATYVHLQNPGIKWGGDDYWEDMEKWCVDDERHYLEIQEANRQKERTVDQGKLLEELKYELAEIPVGSGMRHEEVKRLLAKYKHKGIGDALLSLENPWPSDRSWDREWQNLVDWFIRR